MLSEWVASIGLDPHQFGTHSLRRTKATLISASSATCEPDSFYWVMLELSGGFDSAWG